MRVAKTEWISEVDPFSLTDDPEVCDYVVSLFRNTPSTNLQLFVASLAYRLLSDDTPTRDKRGKMTFPTRYPYNLRFDMNIHDKDDLVNEMNKHYRNYEDDEDYQLVFDNIGMNEETGKIVLGGLGISEQNASVMPGTFFLMEASMTQVEIMTKVNFKQFTQTLFNISEVELQFFIQGYSVHTTIPQEMIRSDAYNRYPMIRRTKEAIRRIK